MRKEEFRPDNFVDALKRTARDRKVDPSAIAHYEIMHEIPKLLKDFFRYLSGKRVGVNDLDEIAEGLDITRRVYRKS